MSDLPRERGSHFEKLAETMLHKAGLRTLARNFSCRTGEIDLIMDDRNILVFVEVRYRESLEYGGPLETITPAKQMRIVRAAQYFLQKHSKYAQRVCRFDAIGLSGSPKLPEIRWIKNAFTA